MNVRQIAERIVARLEEAVDTLDYVKIVEECIWEGIRDFLNTIFRMRHYQKMYFKDRDSLTLKAAKAKEQDIDQQLIELNKQRNNDTNNKQPKLGI